MTLEVRGLSYAFQGHDEPYLRGVDLKVRDGEIVVISGPSGGGKSTLIRCIDGIYPHVNGGTLQGEILFDGKPVTGLAPESRCSMIGTVFQDFDSQILHLTVEDELAFGPENMGVSKEEIKKRVKRASSVIGLDIGADPGTLSDGNKQRLCIGSALAMETPVLLLDEPMSSLDIHGARELMSFLHTLKESGRSIVIVEHRLALVRDHADRILWMEGGVLSEAVPDMPPAGPRACVCHPPEKAAEAISINGLSFAYTKGCPVLSSVSFSVKRGEMAVILGRNGSGKSTLLKILAGLLPVQVGSAEIFGQNIKGKRAGFFRGRVGLVMQNPNHQLFMDSAYNEIFFNCNDAALTSRLLGTFGLARLKDRHPYSLSEGEKRRLALASVLASRPSVLLLDEPTLGQDRDNMTRMIDALAEYNRDTGLTVVTVTHEEMAARSLGSRALTLENASEYSGDGPDAVEKYFLAGDRHGRENCPA